MRRIARPVAVGRDQLDAHQLVGARPRLRAHEVVDLSRRRARAAELDSDVVGRAVCGGPNASSHLDVAMATSPPAAACRTTVALRGAYAKSVTRSNTETRPSSRKCWPSMVTSTSVADNGSTTASLPPRSIERSTPGANKTTIEARIRPPGIVGGQRNSEIAGRRACRQVDEVMGSLPVLCSLLHQVCGASDRTGNVARRRVQQGASDHEATHSWLMEGILPQCEGRLRIRTRARRRAATAVASSPWRPWRCRPSPGSSTRCTHSIRRAPR